MAKRLGYEPGDLHVKLYLRLYEAGPRGVGHRELEEEGLAPAINDLIRAGIVVRGPREPGEPIWDHYWLRSAMPGWLEEELAEGGEWRPRPKRVKRRPSRR